MAALAFDTHAFVKELTAAGFSEAQAEAVTTVVRRSREVELAAAATKADLDVRVSKAEADIIRWVAGLIGFQTLVVLGAVVALVKFVRP